MAIETANQGLKGLYATSRRPTHGMLGGILSLSANGAMIPGPFGGLKWTLREESLNLGWILTSRRVESVGWTIIPIQNGGACHK